MGSKSIWFASAFPVIQAICPTMIDAMTLWQRKVELCSGHWHFSQTHAI